MSGDDLLELSQILMLAVGISRLAWHWLDLIGVKNVRPVSFLFPRLFGVLMVISVDLSLMLECSRSARLSWERNIALGGL
jgi:hypothetical protein